jgi:hypothetical protein
MNNSKHKFNTLILLSVASFLLSMVFGIFGVEIFTKFSMGTNYPVSIIVTAKILLETLFYILPAVWVSKNPPNSLNNWMSLLLIIAFKFNGVLAYFMLIGIDHLQEKQKTEPVK